MEIGQFKEYRGYVGSIEYDSEDKMYYGRLMNIRDLVDYHEYNLIDLNDEFHNAVDDYIEFKADLRPRKLEKKPDVYIVTSGDYSDYAIRSIFKNRDKAELYCSCHSGCEIEEYVWGDNTIYTTFNVVTLSGKVGIRDPKMDYLELQFEALTEEDDGWKNENKGYVDRYSSWISLTIHRKLPEKYNEELVREKYKNVFYDFAPEIRYIISELSQMSESEKDMKIRNDVLAAISSKFGIEKL